MVYSVFLLILLVRCQLVLTFLVWVAAKHQTITTTHTVLEDTNSVVARRSATQLTKYGWLVEHVVVEKARECLFSPDSAAWYLQGLITGWYPEMVQGIPSAAVVVDMWRAHGVLEDLELQRDEAGLCFGYIPLFTSVMNRTLNVVSQLLWGVV